MLRSLLLRMSRSRFLERQVVRRRFARRAVRRFLPGEGLDDALAAAASLQRHGLGIVLTRLGENVDQAAGAEEVAQHYVLALDRLAALGLGGQVSVKPSQLGMDLGRDVARRSLDIVLAKADELRCTVWLDMEDSSYVDGTLDLVRHARARTDRVGVCLQAYLHRTPDDLAGLIESGTRVRLVKGAYRDPQSVALTRRSDVDTRFHDLAGSMLAHPAYPGAAIPVFGTHDHRLIESIRLTADRCGVSPSYYEFHLLYGIRTDLQERLAAGGARVAVLISYGEQWFPWFMRRLAERPANIGFVLRQLAG